MPTVVSGFDGSVDETEDAIRDQYRGTAVGVVEHTDLRVTANSTGTRVVDIAAGTSYAHAVRASFDATSLTLDAVTLTGQSRWDAIVLRRDWGANTVTPMVVKGIASVGAPKIVPAGLLNSPGVIHDQLLALAQVTFNVITPVVEDRRLWANKTIYASNLASLPILSDLFGAEAIVGTAGNRYRLGLNASSALAWIQVGADFTEFTAAQVLVSDSGWTTSNLTARAFYNATTGETELNIEERRSGATLVAAAGSGNFPDTPVCVVKDPFRPDVETPFSGQYNVSANNTSRVWLPCIGSLGTSGQLMLLAGAPGQNLPQRALSNPPAIGDVSLRLQIKFTRKV